MNMIPISYISIPKFRILFFKDIMREQTCKQSNRSNRKVIDCSQLQCNSNSNRLKFFKCNSNRLKFYLLHLLLSIIFLLQFTLCYFLEGGCRKMIALHGL